MENQPLAQNSASFLTALFKNPLNAEHAYNDLLKKGYKKVDKIMENFEELYTDFLNEDAMEFDIGQRIDVQCNMSGPKVKKEKKSKFSKEHTEGKCMHKFKSGKNKDNYCNSKTCEDDGANEDYCKSHQPKDEKEHVQCASKKVDGTKCAKSATKVHEGKQYCSVHYNKIVNPSPKKSAKSSKSSTRSDSDNESDVDTKKKPVQTTNTGKPKKSIVNVDITDTEDEVEEKVKKPKKESKSKKSRSKSNKKYESDDE